MSYTLLETINYVISQTGAAPVTDINDPLPDVASAKLRIEEARVETLKRGMWFNTSRGQEYTIDLSNQIPIGADVLKVLKSSPLFLIPRDGYLYSPQLRTNEFVFLGSDPVTVDLVLDMDYDDMPYSAQDVIRYSAARQHVLHELEDDTKAAQISLDLNNAVMDLRKEETEINRYAIDANPTARAREARRTLLAHGWWFNTERGVELNAVGGKFAVPADTLKTLATLPELCVPRSGYYYSTVSHTNTHAFSTLTVDRVVDVETADLPEEAKAVVRAAAHRELILEEQAVYERAEDKVAVAQGTVRVEAAEADYQQTYRALLMAEKKARYANIASGQTQRQEQEQAKVLKRGWWFNTELGVTITKDGDDKYPVPSNVLKVLRTYPQILIERNGFLYSMSENTDVFPDEAAEVQVDVVTNMPYIELPSVVQDVVRLRAEREWALNEEGDLNKVQLLDKDLMVAKAEMVKDDLELRKHTRADNPSFWRLRGGVRPYRRGGRTTNPNYPGGSI